ncbi:hypothetical protein EDD85DRAFT_935984 [Armillaria nabsnona]|nr:hypothetical protein EDD85DRAFT_935984 [Armillaria nabsnona]
MRPVTCASEARKLKASNATSQTAREVKEFKQRKLPCARKRTIANQMGVLGRRSPFGIQIWRGWNIRSNNTMPLVLSLLKMIPAHSVAGMNCKSLPITWHEKDSTMYGERPGREYAVPILTDHGFRKPTSLHTTPDFSQEANNAASSPAGQSNISGIPVWSSHRYRYHENSSTNGGRIEKFPSTITDHCDVVYGYSIEANPGQSPLGLNHITSEASTNDDGYVPEALLSGPPSILGGNEVIVRTVDGLHWGSRDGLSAYSSGVIFAIAPPVTSGFFLALGVSLSNSCAQKLQADAVFKELPLVLALRFYEGPFWVTIAVN